MSHPILNDAQAKMKKAVDHTLHEFSSIHTGKATPAMIEGVMVDAYGSMTPLKQCAAISTPDARLLQIQPWDATLTGPDAPAGSLHPLTRTRERILASFRKLGFTVAEGPEIETEWHCFDALNTPADHPARDMQDTLYMPKAFRSADAPRKGEEALVLRTHTSSVQVRTMLSRKPPFRIVAPGRCFRRDAVDATHSANFHQVEGLWIDRNVTLADLRGVLDFFVKETFGPDAEIRLRPSFFPFTEPSFEMDLRSPNLGRLSNRWLEIMGCGLVDPKVLELCGLDPEEFSGLAFGLGLERIAMLVHGIDDIRHFYNNDLRFLRQFA